ncbi:MAG: phosphoribosylaminoimidazolesuccinocarboxamide synthase [Candidatus Margulisiibacteriota bacterium]|jgi:phosphoribosylaminoimidazole-succinocarboxamide synthase
MSKALTDIDLPGLKLAKKGKVRNIYEVDEYYLMVTSDRISAFDFILPNGIPDKGKLLTKISVFWFDKLKNIVENHLVSADVKDFPKVCQQYADILEGRSMLVKKAEVMPVECIVRGYLSGSGWKEYQRNQSICGIALPAGMKESEKLIAPIFTPTTKAEVGVHDENIDFTEVERLVGKVNAAKLRDLSLKIYLTARDYAETKGIIIADTKFEFGLIDGEIVLVDEVLTPDSSRFWPADKYQVGRGQPSFDKQFVRDYLLDIKWAMQPPVPNLPEEIISKTGAKYKEACDLLMK